jgi:HK97 family phage portal protein
MPIKDYIPFLKSSKQENPLPKFSEFDKNEKDYRFIERITNFKLSELADYESYLKGATEKVWASFKACDITSNTILQTQYEVASEGGTVVNNTDLNNLLAEPNPHDTFEELLYLTCFHLKAVGNAYWLKDRIDSAGRPSALYPLLPQYVNIETDESTKIKSYEYKINGKIIDLDPSEIIHFKRPHPNESVFGLGDIEASQPLFNTFINNDNYSQNFYKNGAFPSGVLVRDEYDGDEVDWQRMKRKWASEYTGQGSQGRTAWLNGKWSYIQLGLSNKDLQTIEQSELNTEQIFLAHGVPLSVAGIKESSNYATARQEYINFRRHTVLPMVQLIFSRINHPTGFIKAFNKNWKLSYKLSGLIDVEQAAKDYELLVKYGAMTLNEYRTACGLDESSDENHSRYYTESTRVPLEIAGAESILMSERFRLPSDQELDNELQDNEIQLPDDPELKEDREEEKIGQHPDSIHLKTDKVLIINPTKEVYDGYPRTAKLNARKSVGFRNSGFSGGTLKMWAIATRMSKGEKLSLEQVQLVASKIGLIKEKNKSYGESKYAVHLDAFGGASGMKWAKDLLDGITNKSIDWEKVKEEEYFRDADIEDLES